MPTNPNTAEPAKPRRRWHQFRLRTLLIGVALIGTACGYVAHEWRIVAARKAYYMANLCIVNELWGTDLRVVVKGDPLRQPSLIRRLLGDSSRPSLEIPANYPPAFTAETQLLFPEATLLVWQ
jgi:hypothetical protein